MIAKAVTVLVCLWLLCSEATPPDVAAGYLSFDPERAATFWQLGTLLGVTGPCEKPWWGMFPPRQNAEGFVWAHKAEVNSLRYRLHHR